ncbi:ribonuclease HI [Flavipsychrobacter stenotrophus]|uniref:ribonuclease H n=1 Tax=Flavipsychrobacter stenotrophus TaxID=2077091 RepID=A0A2S7SZ26_9BACT|nr:ribonuclease HI [Flavipsychrobacter stenotrophus]PQJ12200.1 ribonuclease HI [Flavipsychrobacter stenotrophus]
MSQLIIYTDGSSRGNPGPGGYGIVMQWGSTVKELSQGYRLTTNNRMELLAVIVALESLTRPGIDVTIYTDSAYVVNSIEKKWVFGWAKKGFVGKKNADLWARFLLIYKKHNVKMVWVKGHATNAGNNRCDALATEAADSRKWLEDVGYEKETA